MAIGQEYKAELSRRIDISELIGSYVELKRAGRLERGLCPFHNEKTPSFYVYPETSSFCCFGCNAAGDAITFVMHIQNLDYVEAVKFLAARAGMPMPDEDDSTARLRGRVLSINRETAKFFVKCLNEPMGHDARGYLRGRALSDATIRRFGLGFAPDDFGRLRDHMKALGFTEDELVDAGVCKRSEKGGVYDAFRNRVTFPIMDLRGNVIAFGARLMGQGNAKYLNSPETMVFRKGQNLFALALAKKSVSRRFLLAEGYMDVISLHQAGFDTAVATLGTALTTEQAKLISDYADEVIICYDSDEAGQKATTRAINIFSNTNVKVGVLSLPEAKDPDEFIRRFGAERFTQVLDGSGNTIEYALAKAKKKFDLTNPDGRSGYIRAALDVLAAEARPTEQDIYAGRIAEETDVAKAAVLLQLDGVVRARRKRLTKEREKRMRGEGIAAGITLPYSATGSKALGVAFAEQQLVAAVLKNPEDFLSMAAAGVAAEHFISLDMQQAFELLVQKGQQGDQIDLLALSGELPEKTIALLGKVLALNNSIGFSKEDVAMFIQRIQSGAEGPDKAAGMSAGELEQHFAAMRDKKQ